MGQFVAVPHELHLEILRRFDLPSLIIMRAVNRSFRDLVDMNQDTIVRAILRDTECSGPHAILLRQYPPKDSVYSLTYAKDIYEIKRTILRVAQVCQLTTKAKIEALYCLDYLCATASHFPFDEIEDIGETTAEFFRHKTFSQYNTFQLQQMLPAAIRLIYKIAELMGIQYQGSVLRIDDYSRFNRFLLANGVDLIVELAKRTPVQREGYMLGARDIEVEIPRIHDEIIIELHKRGTGLMTEPGIEIQQFFQEEDTYLDIRQSNGE